MLFLKFSAYYINFLVKKSTIKTYNKSIKIIETNEVLINIVSKYSVPEKKTLSILRKNFFENIKIDSLICCKGVNRYKFIYIIWGV